MNEKIKQYVKRLLLERNFSHLLGLCESDKKYWQQVRFNLYEVDEKIQWSAIEMFALMMKRWWEKGSEEKVRQYMRNLFWSINDESGGIGWHAPQTIAETIINIPSLVDPYASMMIAHCIDEPPLVKGCLWGIGRLGEMIVDSVYFFKDKVLSVFQFEDLEILGIAAWAMGEVKFQPAEPLLRKLLAKESEVKIYISGDFQKKSIRKWAEEAIIKISGPDIKVENKLTL